MWPHMRTDMESSGFNAMPIWLAFSHLLNSFDNSGRGVVSTPAMTSFFAEFERNEVTLVPVSPSRVVDAGVSLADDFAKRVVSFLAVWFSHRLAIDATVSVFLWIPFESTGEDVPWLATSRFVDRDPPSLCAGFGSVFEAVWLIGVTASIPASSPFDGVTRFARHSFNTSDDWLPKAIRRAIRRLILSAIWKRHTFLRLGFRFEFAHQLSDTIFATFGRVIHNGNRIRRRRYCIGSRIW